MEEETSSLAWASVDHSVAQSELEIVTFALSPEPDYGSNGPHQLSQPTNSNSNNATLQSEACLPQQGSTELPSFVILSRGASPGSMQDGIILDDLQAFREEVVAQLPMQVLAALPLKSHPQ
jgi:hypothetical protein